jgi:crossover junction endodeoxyribonuclease RuvC
VQPRCARILKPGPAVPCDPSLRPALVVRAPAYPSTVKVLGIDPGTATCGYGVVDARGGRVTALASGCWTTRAGVPIELRLRVIFDGVQALIAEHAPDAMAVEESIVGADARIALSVGQARGAALVAAATAGVDCAEYSPTRVKKSVCGHGAADKGQVQRMVKMLLSLDAVPATSHEADALAVAICHALMPPLARMAS